MGYWSYRGGSSSSKKKVAPSSSVWQQAGTTMSIKNACAQYGVTVEQCQEAELECQWRSSFGNPYAVVKVADVVALKKQLDQAKAEKEEQELIAKHGEEGYAKMKQEAKDKEEAKKKAAAAKAENERNQRELVQKLNTLFSFVEYGIVDIDDLVQAKTAAKQEWFLKDSDLVGLACQEHGKTKKYNVADLIAKAEQKHSLGNKLQSSKTSSRYQRYAGYLKKKLEEEMDDDDKYSADVVAAAKAQIKKQLKLDVHNSVAEVRAAQQKLKTKQAKVRSFDEIFENEKDKNTKPSPSEKAKTTSA